MKFIRHKKGQTPAYRHDVENVKRLMTFLEESNKIENVYGFGPLTDARWAWEYLQEFNILSTHNILQTHLKLMAAQPIEQKYRGHFRDVDVWIGGRKGITPSLIEWAMEHWINRANTAESWSEIKSDHILFERIHPFIDGNGRIGRILMNWQRVKNKLPIEIIYDSKKYSYYKWFEGKQ